jgi:PAS domain S-box-containing protein
MSIEHQSQNTELFQQLKRNMQGVFLKFLNDKKNTIIDLDSDTFNLFGYTSDELLDSSSMNYLTLIHLEDRKWLSEKRMEQMKSNLPLVNEYRIISKQGKIKWVKEIISLVVNDKTEKVIFDAYVEDITAFKLNAFMSNAFTSYQNAVNSGSIVSITDKSGKILFVNDLFCTVSKYSRQELIGNDHKLLSSNSHSKGFFEKLWKTILSGEIWRGQIKNVSKNNQIFWLDTVISPIKNEKGIIDQFLAISNNITEQKESEYALLESETLNRTIIKSLHTGVAIVDETGLITKVNENWHLAIQQMKSSMMCNIPSGANFFKHLEQLIDSGNMSAKEIMDNIHSVLDREIEFAEIEYPCISGEEERWFYINITMFENDISHIIISNFDITHRKNQEAILRKSESRMNEAQRIAKIGSWELDLISDTIQGSPEVFHIFDVDSIDGETWNFSDFIEQVHPEDREMVTQTYLESLANKSNFNVVHRIVTKDGSVKYIKEQCITFYDSDGKPLRSLGTAQDVTEQKQFELSLEQERKRYQNVVENISDGLFIDNIDGKVVYANSRFLNIIGIGESDLLDFDFMEFVAPEYREEIKDRHNRRMRGEDVQTIFEYQGIRKNGEKRWIEARVTKIEENGVIVGTQSAIRDITESKRSIDLIKASESEKTKLLNELTRRFNELMQFNYIVSHNLRAPIANLIGLSEAFKMKGVDEKERLKIIGLIQYSVLKIDDLIQDLNIILATKSDLNSKKEIIVFASIMEAINSILERQIIQTGANINFVDNSNGIQFYSIKSYMKSILYNLLSNSIKYKSAERALEVDIKINVKKHEKLIIEVKDNGMGIDLKMYGAEIFGLYKRFHIETEGKGLGLNMTKTQVEALGGKIDVKSTLGHGATFIVELPLDSVIY